MSQQLRIDYKGLYENLVGDATDKLKCIVAEHYDHWALNGEELIVADILTNRKASFDLIFELLLLLIRKGVGNAEFKRAFVELRAAMEGEQRTRQQLYSKLGLPWSNLSELG